VVLITGKVKAVIESGMKRRATAKVSVAEQVRAKEIEALDLIIIKFKGQGGHTRQGTSSVL
jgi:hypothetical protein